MYLLPFIVGRNEEQALQQPENLSNTSDINLPSKENENNQNLTIDNSKSNTSNFTMMHPAFQIKTISDNNISSIVDSVEVKTYTELQSKLYKENHLPHLNNVNLMNMNGSSNRISNDIDGRSNFSDSDCCNSSDSEEIDLTSGMGSTVAGITCIDFSNNNNNNNKQK